MYTENPNFLPAPSQEQDIPMLQGLSIFDFMQKTSIYEESPIPISALLRRSAWMGALFAALACLGLAILPPLSTTLHTLDVNVLSGLNRWRDGSIDVIVNRPWLDAVEGALLLSILPLLIITRGLQRGPLWQHICVCIYVVISMLNLLVVGLGLLLVLTDLLFWGVCIVLGLAFALAVLYAMFARRQ